jgi:hypothetical protein
LVSLPVRWVLFDELVARAASDEADLVAAREEWGQATGRVHPDHELYAERSDAFVEWFVLERRSLQDGLTWVERGIVERQRAAPPAEAATGGTSEAKEDAAIATYRALRAAHRSLFQVAAAKTPARTSARTSASPPALASEAPDPGAEAEADELLLDDLLGGAQFRVEARLPFVQVGDLFEARIVPDPEAPPRLLLLRAVLFHPRDAAPAVQDHVARAQRRGEPRSALLARLLRLRLRALAYRHVKPQRIYSRPDALP